jgi:hypothetical protein
MVSDLDGFAWQPTESRRSPRILIWLAIITASAGVGVALGRLRPVERLVSAVERNGVAKAPAPAPLPSSTPIPEPSVNQAAEASAVPKTVLLNPGTVKEEEAPPAVAEAAAIQGGEAESGPAKEPTKQAEAKAPPPSTPAANRRERKVLVIVRRVIPPYDKRVVRGTITGGRLVLDSRDSKGMTIR